MISIVEYTPEVKENKVINGHSLIKLLLLWGEGSVQISYMITACVKLVCFFFHDSAQSQLAFNVEAVQKSLHVEA